MKRKYSYWLLFAVPLLLLCSCKKSYVVDFKVLNDSDDAILVMLQRTESSAVDTSFLDGGQDLIIHTEMGEKLTAKKYVFDLTELPFHNIIVQNVNGLGLLCDEDRLSCWNRTSNSDAKEYGSVFLQVTETSF